MDAISTIDFTLYLSRSIRPVMQKLQTSIKLNDDVRIEFISLGHYIFCSLARHIQFCNWLAHFQFSLFFFTFNSVNVWYSSFDAPQAKHYVITDFFVVQAE